MNKHCRYTNCSAFTYHWHNRWDLKVHPDSIYSQWKKSKFSRCLMVLEGRENERSRGGAAAAHIKRPPPEGITSVRMT